MEFEKAFKTFVIERLEENSELENQSPEYLRRYKESSDALRKLMDSLTEEQKKLFLEYNQADGAVMAITEEEAYIKGFSDGLRFSKLLGGNLDLGSIPYMGRRVADAN